MKSFLITILSVGIFAACNSPEPNSTVGNSEDSTTVNNHSMGDSANSSGPGLENSGSTPGAATMTDTALHGKTDSLIQTSSSPRDFRKKKK